MVQQNLTFTKYSIQNVNLSMKEIISIILVLYCHSTKAKANLIYPILRSLHHNTPKSCKQKLQCKRKKLSIQIKRLNDTVTILALQESPSKLTCHKIKC